MNAIDTVMDPSLCQGALGEIMADEAPVIVAGCKLDLRDERNPWSFEHVVAPLMQHNEIVDVKRIMWKRVPEDKRAIFCFSY
uniref:Mitochondrial Rho GTPase 2-like isoform X2 n=1 Tax=Tanacetum cinerariifolium TaxID=118510 RepID=A0A699JD19_TANCI|nr:mitochondrial Rho GTPase 2-like isoform X2 [Tanacetum cinerariifolium]